jgi:hypothetical protein
VLRDFWAARYDSEAMRQIDPLWWVAAALLTGGLFAVGIHMYVGRAIEQSRGEALAQIAREAPAEHATSQLDAAAAVASAFVADVAAGRFAAAHARLASPYRAAVTVGDFAAGCRELPMLTGARAVRLNELRQQSVAGAASIEGRGLLDSAAGAIPIGFVFLREPALKILVVSLAGVPVLQGVAPARHKRP